MEAKSEITTSTCICYWVIEEPSGSKSIGTCKKCGNTKEFFNYTDTSVWSSEYNYDTITDNNITE